MLDDLGPNSSLSGQATSVKTLVVSGVNRILGFAVTLVTASPVMTYPATNLIAPNARGVTGNPFLKSQIC